MITLIEQASTCRLVNTSETSLVNTTQTAAASVIQTPTSQVILPQNINKEGVALKRNRLEENTQDTVT